MGDTNVSSSGANAVGSSSRPTFVPSAKKPGKFSSVDFKRWQQKMFFYLATLSLQRFITADVLVPSYETSDSECFLVTEAWKHSDFLCNNYILSGPDDCLYNVYSMCKTSKELWDVLEKKYKTEDAGLKKFVAAKFLEFKMVDNKTVICHKCRSCKSLCTISSPKGWSSMNFIEKLPQQWRDFKNYLDILRRRIEQNNSNFHQQVPLNQYHHGKWLTF